MSVESVPFIQLDKDQLPFCEIHRRFAQTPPGQRLDKNTRWGRFQPPHISNSEWIQHLGFDANNLEHCRLTYGLTTWFINQQNQSDYPIKFDPDDQDILKLTALTHDWPEGITKKGDVNYEAKTQQDEQEELAVISTAITNIVGQSYEATRFSIQVKDCLEDTSSVLGRAFNCIESLGYLRTALIVWPKSQVIQDEILSQQLQMLTINVLYNSIPKLIRYSDSFYPAKKFLLERKSVIDHAFLNMPESGFDGYQDKKTEKINSFMTARRLWNEQF